MRKIRIPLLALGLLAVYVWANAVSVWSYGSRDETRRADVAIVLGAAAYESGVSPVYRERINQGIRLYRLGYVDKLLFAGGVGKGNEHSDAFIGMEYALTKGIPREDILLEETSRITEENLANAKTILNAQGLSTALIVSDPLHMRRAMRMAYDCGIDAYPSPTQSTMYRTMETKLDFWKREVLYYVGYKWLHAFGL